MMCGSKKKVLARKYARTFLKVFNELNKDDLFASIERLQGCCQQSPLVFYTLLLSSARLDDKLKAVDELARRLELVEPVTRLLETLLRRKKIDILPALLPIIMHEYKKKYHLLDVVVTSAHPLTATQKERVEALVSTQLSGELTFIYQQDSTLIAGIKIQTPTHYWEHSVAKVARTLEHRLAMQETI